MANYAVTTYNVKGDYDSVMSSLETKIETIDSTKSIRVYTIVPRGNEFAGILVYDT